MSDHSAIQWCDATWNPTTGCTKISPGCAHCYIERTPAFRINGRKFVNGSTDLQLHENRLEQPLHWRKPRRVFVNSLSDLFHEDISDAFIDRVFAVMALTPQHTYQVLTKRPARMRDYLLTLMGSVERMDNLNDIATDVAHDCIRATAYLQELADTIGERWPLPNVWLGVSVENQHFADERIPLLLQTPAAVRFISAEPLLEGLDIAKHRPRALGLHWCIVGGESGPNSRPCRQWWIRNIVGQCRDAGVSVFVKQLGSNSEFEQGCGDCDPCTGGARCPYGAYHLRAELRDKKGGDPDEWPADLRVREFPAAAPALQPQAATSGSA